MPSARPGLAAGEVVVLLQVDAWPKAEEQENEKLAEQKEGLLTFCVCIVPPRAGFRAL